MMFLICTPIWDTEGGKKDYPSPLIIDASIEATTNSVSYTHLTLPTSDLV